MEVLVSLMALIGMGFAAFAGIKWMLKNGHMNPQKEQPLTPNDLRVLEESAARLMADLRAVTDDCVARIEHACAEAETRIGTLEEAEKSSSAVMGVCQSVTTRNLSPAPVTEGILPSTEPAVNVARQSGMTTGEVELLRGLESLSTK